MSEQVSAKKRGNPLLRLLLIVVIIGVVVIVGVCSVCVHLFFSCTSYSKLR